MQIVQITFLFLLTTLCLACEKKQEKVQQNVSFERNIAPIISTKCINCHTGDRTPLDLSVGEYYATLSSANYIVRGNPGSSLLYHQLENDHSIVNTLTPEELRLFWEWIEGGALKN